MPVAANCCMAPWRTVGFAGVTLIETRAGAVTVRTVEPATVPNLAVIVVVPTACPCAKPAAVMIATDGEDEVQVTFERICVLLSENVPVAVNCCVLPLATDGFAGVTVMDWSTAGATVSVRVAEAVLAELAESVTWTVTEGAPAAKGVPEITPVAGSMFSPLGSPNADQCNTGVPPVAETAMEYAVPTYPVGKDVVVICNGAGAMVNVVDC